MAWSFSNRIKVSTSTTGTGSITPGSTSANCYAFSTLTTGDRFFYDLTSGTDNEIGIGTWTGSVISRDTILKSTNSNSAITLAGTSTIAIVVPGEFANAVQMPNLLRNSTFQFGSRWYTPSTLTTVNNDAYGLDGWNVLTQATSIQVQQVAGSSAQYGMYLYNNAGSSKRVGACQILESGDSIPRRSQPVTFQVRVKCDESTKNVRVAIVEWTGTADTVTSNIVNSWTNSTFTAGNFFTSTSTTVAGTAQITCTTGGTWYSGSVTATVSASCNNLMAFVWSEDTLTTANGMTVECVDMHVGRSTQNFMPLPAVEEELRCQRFIYALRGQQYLAGFKIIGAQIQSQYNDFPVRMRATPTGTMVSGLSWVTAGTSGAQVSFTGRVTANYLTITGALTAACTAYSADRYICYFIAATSFSGTIGEVGTLDLGSSLIAYWDAEL